MYYTYTDKKQLTALHHAIMLTCLPAVKTLCAAGQQNIYKMSLTMSGVERDKMQIPPGLSNQQKRSWTVMSYVSTIIWINLFVISGKYFTVFLIGYCIII